MTDGGETVFSATGGPSSGWETVTWDGFYKGKIENAAVFAWYMKAVLTDGTSINKKGNILLIK